MEHDENGQNNLPPVENNDLDDTESAKVTEKVEINSNSAEIAERDSEVTDKAKSVLRTKSVFSVIGTVITVIILLITAFIVVNIVIARVQNRNVSLFGYSFGIVQTNSMEPEIKVGDMIIYKSCDITEVEVGDDIVFIAGSGFGQIEGQNVIHRVQSIVADGGNYRITTKGINNVAEDVDKVTAENFLGICTYYSSFWGATFTFISKYGIFVLVALIAVPFIAKQIKKIVKIAREGDGGE